MPVERKTDGSVSIKNNNGISVISRITGVSDEKFQQWVENCSKLVTPCAHTLKETEQYFLEQCDAVPLVSNDRSMMSFQFNVIMNHYKDKLEHHAPEFSFDMTDEEMEGWYKEDNAMREEAKNLSPEQFGFNIHGYYLPHTRRNEFFYEEAYEEVQKLMKNTNQDPNQLKMQDICFFLRKLRNSVSLEAVGIA